MHSLEHTPVHIQKLGRHKIQNNSLLLMYSRNLCLSIAHFMMKNAANVKGTFVIILDPPNMPKTLPIASIMDVELINNFGLAILDKGAVRYRFVSPKVVSLAYISIANNK